MSALVNLLLADALKIVLPIVAEQFAKFAAEKEPEVKAYLTAHFGDESPLVEELYKLLIEPGLVTIGGLLTTIGGAAPVSHSTSAVPQAAGPVIPVYNQD